MPASSLSALGPLLCLLAYLLSVVPTSDVREASGAFWALQAVVLAGFRVEELAMVRVILDTAGGYDIKVIPCTEELLHTSVEKVLRLPEPQWELPRPESWTRGGAWGSNRAILFAGMKLTAQAALVELLESSGLPPVCVAVAFENEKHYKVGEILAEAVKEQRGRKNPKLDVWEESTHLTKEIPQEFGDLEEIELPEDMDFEDFVRSQAAAAMEGLEKNVREGNWGNIMAKQDLDGEEQSLRELAEAFRGAELEGEESPLGSAVEQEDFTEGISSKNDLSGRPLGSIHASEDEENADEEEPPEDLSLGMDASGKAEGLLSGDQEQGARGPEWRPEEDFQGSVRDNLEAMQEQPLPQAGAPEMGQGGHSGFEAKRVAHGGAEIGAEPAEHVKQAGGSAVFGAVQDHQAGQRVGFEAVQERQGGQPPVSGAEERDRSQAPAWVGAEDERQPGGGVGLERQQSVVLAGLEGCDSESGDADAGLDLKHGTVADNCEPKKGGTAAGGESKQANAAAEPSGWVAEWGRMEGGQGNGSDVVENELGSGQSNESREGPGIGDAERSKFDLAAFEAELERGVEERAAARKAQVEEHKAQGDGNQAAVAEAKEKLRRESLDFMRQLGQNVSTIPRDAAVSDRGDDVDLVPDRSLLANPDIIDAIVEGREINGPSVDERQGGIGAGGRQEGGLAAPFLGWRGAAMGPAQNPSGLEGPPGGDFQILTDPRGPPGADLQKVAAQAVEGRAFSPDEVAQALKESVKDLPAQDKQQLANDLRVLQAEKSEVEGVLKDIDAVFGGMKGKVREELQAKLKEEALQPTRDAIQAALACGLSAEELMEMVTEAAGKCRMGVAPISEEESQAAMSVMRARNVGMAKEYLEQQQRKASSERKADSMQSGAGVSPQLDTKQDMACSSVRLEDSEYKEGGNSIEVKGQSMGGAETEGFNAQNEIHLGRTSSTDLDDASKVQRPLSQEGGQIKRSERVSTGLSEAQKGPAHGVSTLKDVDLVPTVSAGGIGMQEGIDGGSNVNGFTPASVTPRRVAGEVSPGVAPKPVRSVQKAGEASRVLTAAELRSLAERRGLAFEDLMADALSKGVQISDG
eukprot:jgi/Botrbrau1/13795/Bobra.0056s0045.2